MGTKQTEILKALTFNLYNRLLALWNLTSIAKCLRSHYPSPTYRAEGYRELAMLAINSVAGYKLQAEKYAERGEAQIAHAHQQLTNEAVAGAERYLLLANFAEKNG